MMKIAKTLGLITLSLIISTASTFAQFKGYTHDYSPVDGYVIPKDTAVLEKLDQWQDLKFGVLLCMGLYSVPGMMESWNLCSEDEQWEYQFRIDHGMSYDEFKKWYWGLDRFLNPTKFNPDIWADVMKDAGIKYMLFSTKHHDGFCMFDSKYTDFKITSGACKVDITKEVLRAFRDKGFMVGEYFSKPDWHCEWFWNPLFATPDRMQNYDRKKHPDWWEKYVKFTMNQLTELTSDYGNIDILWLDGGWIRGKEINIGEVLRSARKHSPGMICVDRCSRDEYEEYQTPECTIPDEQRNIPWETCAALQSWGYQYNPAYKSARTIIAQLAEIVAKGGNYLLGIGPTPWGTIDDLAQARLHEIGEWLTRNGEAIYSTGITKTYHDGNIWFTESKDGSAIYGIYALKDNESLPGTIEWTGNIPSRGITAISGGTKLKYTVNDGKVTLTIPKNARLESFAFKIQ